MFVHHPPQQHGLAGLAVAAPVADLVGRLLAPALLATCPAFVVALSPSDPHLLLATRQSLVLLVSVAFVARLGRAWAIFRTTDHLAHRLRPGRMQRLLRPSTDSLWRWRGAIGAVVVLPGMVGAVLAARARVQARLYLALAATSTAGGLLVTLAAARLFEDRLAEASALLTGHALEATLLISALTVITVLIRRARASSGIHRS